MKQDIRLEHPQLVTPASDAASALSQMGAQVLAQPGPGAVQRLLETLPACMPGMHSAAVVLSEHGILLLAGQLNLDSARVDDLPAEGQLPRQGSTVFSVGQGELAAVPLLGKQEPAGWLAVWFDDGCAAKNISLLQGAASWASAAVAMERQQLEIERALEENQTFSRISRALSETLDLDQIFQLIVDSAHQLIPHTQGAVIHRLDEDAGTLQSAAVSGATGPSRPSMVMPVGSGIAGQVLEYGETIYVPDVTCDSRCLPLGDSPMRALLVSPIQVETVRFGTISVHSPISGAFTESDSRTLQMLGVEAALAIQNARLYQNERVHRQQAEAMAQVAVLLNQSLDLDQVVDTILEQLPRVVHCKNVNIMLIEGDQINLIRQGRYEDSFWQVVKQHTDQLQDPASRRYSMGVPSLRQMVETRQPVLFRDTAKEPAWLPIPNSAWIRSYLGVPFQVGDELLGFLNLNSEQPNFFGDSIVPALQSFTAHASIAIQNARQYQRLQTSLNQEKAMRAQLIQADRLAAMGRMAGSIAHEINNPIQAIQGCLERTQAHLDDPARQRRYLEMAQRELTRLAEIVQRVLSFQRPMAGHFESVDLHYVIEEVLALTDKRLQQSNISVAVHWPERLGPVDAISNQLKQVFLNLVLNAVDAMPEGGLLTIRAELVAEDGIWLKLAFEDTGKGMTRDAIEHLFEPFFSTKASGTGLGLWVSQNILLSHHGRITAESTLGEGSRLVVWLPIDPSKSA